MTVMLFMIWTMEMCQTKWVNRMFPCFQMMIVSSTPMAMGQTRAQLLVLHNHHDSSPARLKNQRGRTPATKDLGKFIELSGGSSNIFQHLHPIAMSSPVTVTVHRSTLHRWSHETNGETNGASPILCLRMVHQPEMLGHQSGDIPQPVLGDVNP